MLLTWGLSRTAAIGCFWKIWVVLKRTFQCLNTAAAVWPRLTVEEAEAVAGLVTADILAV